MSSDVRERLTALRSDAAARLSALDADLAALTRDRITQSDDDEHDPEGEPLSAQWSRLSGLIDGARTELAEVDDALARLDAGTYGVCAACGKPIPAARLEVRPFARLCVPCAEAAAATPGR
ncbi:TraR/DksA family transcriptional regulator [Microbacterium sp. NIBRBAC000506063]|uniref:TraR/DksA family transcriptional regulator n=1 Tax=Microbacterium sp. NIBRBAC000506063 TaxID=2734618 RepID=UPI001BB7D627|nr:TraR/DksA C4-type zinc finger protein [Microbacterium sp. NIBRBAC000506063]QTV78965.1 TraR/DksA C4-type zinc finger protein [Microbacterium sp. NIBRBAC000506063]